MTKGVKNVILGCMKKICLILSVLFLTSVCFAKGTKDKNKIYQIAPNTYTSKLENGITVFISENHSVPLAYIEIAVRAGAITQTKENAGLFHLYEHMMFKGNSLYKNSAAVQKALSDMGTASWNGTTGLECVNYYFTIPKKELKKGLEFWSAAIREPLMDKDEFEIEKKVVISEIQGQYTNPDRLISKYIRDTFYCDAPWQVDPSGSVENVSNATVDDLLAIKNKFYIPENAALFIGGDVNADEVIKMVSEIYGDWSNNGVELAQIEECVLPQNKAPFDKPKYVVIPYDKISPQIAKIEIMYRGPDSDTERDDTITADCFHSYLNDPQSDYVQKFISDRMLLIPNPDYLYSGYSTRRRTGVISFDFYITKPETNLPERVKYANNEVYSYLTDAITKKTIVASSFKVKINQRVKDDAVYEAETSTSILNALRYNWITNDISYYINYIYKIQCVKDKDIVSYVNKYITDKNPLVLVYVNSNLYNSMKEEFKKSGFEELKY